MTDSLSPPLTSQSDRITEWLSQFGFEYNPFEYGESERDKNLEGHYIEHADFALMLDPKHHLFFASTGAGKTALRLRMQSFIAMQ